MDASHGDKSEARREGLLVTERTDLLEHLLVDQSNARVEVMIDTQHEKICEWMNK